MDTWFVASWKGNGRNIRRSDNEIEVKREETRQKESDMGGRRETSRSWPALNTGPGRRTLYSFSSSLLAETSRLKATFSNRLVGRIQNPRSDLNLFESEGKQWQCSTHPEKKSPKYFKMVTIFFFILRYFLAFTRIFWEEHFANFRAKLSCFFFLKKHFVCIWCPTFTWAFEELSETVIA